MRFFVTGGAGFIGSNYVRHLLDTDVVAAVLPGHDVIVNFAAETHVDRSIVEPLEAVRTNTLGVATLAEAARHAGVQRFLQVGTDEEYGTIAEGSFSERDRLEPSSPYSAGKAGGALVALAYATTHQLDGQKVPLYGSGGNIRDWLYVLDHCAAIDLVLRRGATGQVYNVGAGNEVTNLDLTREILAAFGAGEEMIEFVTDRPGHDWRYSLDSTRVRELGWEPAHDFRAGLAETIDWYRRNESWWRPLKPRGASRTLDHGRPAGK